MIELQEGSLLLPTSDAVVFCQGDLGRVSWHVESQLIVGDPFRCPSSTSSDDSLSTPGNTVNSLPPHDVTPCKTSNIDLFVQARWV